MINDNTTLVVLSADELWEQGNWQEKSDWGSKIRFQADVKTPLQLVRAEEVSWMRGGASSKTWNKSGFLRYST